MQMTNFRDCEIRNHDLNKIDSIDETYVVPHLALNEVSLMGSVNTLDICIVCDFIILFLGVHRRMCSCYCFVLGYCFKQWQSYFYEEFRSTCVYWFWFIIMELYNEQNFARISSKNF